MNFSARSARLAFVGVLTSLAGCGAGDDAAHTIGYVEAEWVYVAAAEPGRIVEQVVREGTLVEEGDLLFRLDATAEEARLLEAQARLHSAEAQARNLQTGAREAEIKALKARLAEAVARLARARADYRRMEPLVEQGVEPATRGDAARAEVDTAAATVAALREDIDVAELGGRPAERDAALAESAAAAAAVQSARYALSKRRVLAPVSGAVNELFLRRGEYATAGAPVLALLPPGGLKTRFFVAQAELPSVTIGSRVSVVADGLPEPLQATVSFIAADAEFTPPVIYSRQERQKLLFMVEARLPAESGLHAGLPVEVHW